MSTLISSNANIEIINSQIEGIDFTQECNAGTSKCYQQIGSFSLQVPCEQGEEVRRLTEENINRAYRMRNFQIIILVLGSIILIGVIWYIITLL